MSKLAHPNIDEQQMKKYQKISLIILGVFMALFLITQVIPVLSEQLQQIQRPSDAIIKADALDVLDGGTCYELKVYSVEHDKDLGIYTVEFWCKYDYLYMVGYTPKFGKNSGTYKAEYKKVNGEWQLVSMNHSY